MIQMGALTLPASLTVPSDPIGVVLFAHGSGSSRKSPRNQAVASTLHEARIATLLFDLLTDFEAQERRNVFDITLLAERLLGASDWARLDQRTASLAQGFFGASTGAAAALVAAAQSSSVSAVVSRGGRPDLAGDWLEQVRAPTLLIVGGNDQDVLELNEIALGKLRCTKHLAVVSGATHLFEEPRALETVSHLALDWFAKYLLCEENA